VTEFSDAVASRAHFRDWTFFFSQPVEKRIVNRMIEKLHETGNGKGLIGGDFFIFSTATPSSFTCNFWLICRSFCSDLAMRVFKIKFWGNKRIFTFFVVWGGSGAAVGSGCLPSPSSGSSSLAGGLTARVWVQCKVRYLYLSPLNMGRSSHLILTVRLYLKKKLIWIVHRNLIWTVRSHLKIERIWTVHHV